MCKKNLVSIFILLLVAGCQQAPTRVFESHDYSGHRLSDKLGDPIVVTSKTIVLDARRPFDHTMFHLQGAKQLSWEEFTQPGALNGKLDSDLSKMARRFARLGIEPDSEVVITGYGKKGLGEEGRLAWTLYYLGVQNVQVAGIQYFKNGITQKDSPVRKNMPYWDAKPSFTVLAEYADVRAVLSNPARASQKNKTIIIDVRSKDEFFNRQTFKPIGVTPDIHAIHIPYPEFIDEQGRPNQELAKKLLALGIKKSDRIVLISNRGLRSAAGTFSLLSMGFKRAANFDGGWVELKSKLN